MEMPGMTQPASVVKEQLAPGLTTTPSPTTPTPDTPPPPQLTAEQLIPQLGNDYVGAINQLFTTGSKIIDQILDGCTALMQLMNENDRNLMLQICNMAKQIMMGGETVSRVIWQIPQVHDGANLGISFLLGNKSYQSQAQAYGLFNKWCSECSVPQFKDEIVPNHPTIQEAVRSELYAVGERAREWIGKNIPGLKPEDIDKLAIEWGKLFKEQVIPQLEVHPAIKILAGTRIKHPTPSQTDAGPAIKDIKNMTPKGVSK